MSAVVPSRRFRFLAAVLWALAASVALLASAGGAQAQNGLSGIDVSNWQRQIDWIAVAGTGNSFVFAKATEGTTFTDLTFPSTGRGRLCSGCASARTTWAARRVAPTRPWLRARRRRPTTSSRSRRRSEESSCPCSTSSTTAGYQSRGYRSGCRHGSARSSPVPASSRSSTSRRASGRRSSGTRRSSRLRGTSCGSRTGRPRPCRSCRGRAGAGSAGRSGSGATARRSPASPGASTATGSTGRALRASSSPPTRPARRLSTSAPAIVGGPQAGKLLAALRERGAAASRSRSRTSGSAATPPATPAPRSRLRRRRVHADRRRRRACARRPRQRRHPGGKRVGGLRADPRRRELGAPGGTAPKAKTLPVIQGVNQVGQTLTAQVGTWTGSPTSYSYQWRRCAPAGTRRASRSRRRRRHLHDDARATSAP